MDLLRRVSVVAGAALILGVTAQPAAAAERIDASEFAGRCNGSFHFTISVDTVVEGGSGVLSKDCEVSLGARVRLTLLGVSLSVTPGSRWGMILDGGEASAVEIRDSTIALGGGMNLCPGYSHATAERFDRGEVVIANSTIQGAQYGLIIGASFGAHAGSVEITRSVLRAGPGTAILIQASCGGGTGFLCGEGPAVGGRIDVYRTTLDAGPRGTIDLSTEAAGRTKLRRSVLTAPGGSVAVHAGPSGRCESTDNVPATPCA